MGPEAGRGLGQEARLGGEPGRSAPAIERKVQIPAAIAVESVSVTP